MKNAAADALAALAASATARSKASQIRELMPEILKAKAAGVSEQKIVETLRAQGLDVSIATFKSVLYRWRKANDQAQGNQVGAAGVSPPAPSVEREADPAGRESPLQSSRVVDTAAVHGKANKYFGNAPAEFDINNLMGKGK